MKNLISNLRVISGTESKEDYNKRIRKEFKVKSTNLKSFIINKTADICILLFFIFICIIIFSFVSNFITYIINGNRIRITKDFKLPSEFKLLSKGKFILHSTNEIDMNTINRLSSLLDELKISFNSDIYFKLSDSKILKLKLTGLDPVKRNNYNEIYVPISFSYYVDKNKINAKLKIESLKFKNRDFFVPKLFHILHYIHGKYQILYFQHESKKILNSNQPPRA